MDWESLYCPNRHCRYYGRPFLQGQLVTPAMAASLTDHVWTTTELLSYRVPPHFLDALPDLERLYLNVARNCLDCL